MPVGPGVMPLGIANPLDMAQQGFQFGQQQLAAQRDTAAYNQQQSQQKALADIFSKADTSTPEGQADLVRQVGRIDPKTAIGLQQQFGKMAETGASIAEKQALTAEHRAKSVIDQQDVQEQQRKVGMEVGGEFLRVGSLANSNYQSKIKQGVLPAQAWKESQGLIKQELDSLKSRYGDNEYAYGIIGKVDPDKLTPEELQGGMQQLQAKLGQQQQKPAESAEGKILDDVKSGKLTPEQGKKALEHKDASGGAEKPKWEIKEVTDENGKTKLVRIDANSGRSEDIKGVGPKGAASTSGREAVYTGRILTAANETARDLENIVNLPVTADTGVFGGRKQGPGIFDAGKEVLANKLTSEEVQKYNTRASGLQRNLAAIEASGLAPAGSLTHQMDVLMFKEGDTQRVKLEKLAQTRQIVEAGLQYILDNPRVPDSLKGNAQKSIEKIQKSVPFTIADLDKLDSAQEKNPKATLKSVMPKDAGGDHPEDIQKLLDKYGK